MQSSLNTVQVKKDYVKAEMIELIFSRNMVSELTPSLQSKLRPLLTSIIPNKLCNPIDQTLLQQYLKQYSYNEKTSQKLRKRYI